MAGCGRTSSARPRSWSARSTQRSSFPGRRSRRSGITWSSSCRKQDGSYRPQRILVEAGERLEGEYEVEWGLKAGDKIVSTGAFLLKSELMRDQLAGGE